MVSFNYDLKEINTKIVYYGPGLSGKTTNLKFIHSQVPTERREKLISLATKTDRTLFFDFFPLKLGNIGGYKTRFHLYTVPGQVFYNSTRKVVLTGVDAIVFVADAQKRRLDANIESFENLQENLAEKGLSLDTLPYVIQYNKMDLPDLESIERLNKLLNMHNVPYFKGVAVSGGGVWDTLKGVTNLMLETLSKKGTFAKLGAKSKRKIERKKDKAQPSIMPTDDDWGKLGASPSEKKTETEVKKAPEKPKPVEQTPLPPVQEDTSIGGIELPDMGNGMPSLDELQSTPDLTPDFSQEGDAGGIELPDFDSESGLDFSTESATAPAKTSIGLDFGGDGDVIKKKIHVPIEISTKDLPSSLILDINLAIKFKK